MMALNGASKHLAPKLLLVLGEQRWKDAKNQRLQVAERRKIYGNSTRLTPASRNNRVLAPRNAGI